MSLPQSRPLLGLHLHPLRPRLWCVAGQKLHFLRLAESDECGARAINLAAATSPSGFPGTFAADLERRAARARLLANLGKRGFHCLPLPCPLGETLGAVGTGCAGNPGRPLPRRGPAGPCLEQLGPGNQAGPGQQHTALRGPPRTPEADPPPCGGPSRAGGGMAARRVRVTASCAEIRICSSSQGVQCEVPPPGLDSPWPVRGCPSRSWICLPRLEVRRPSWLWCLALLCNTVRPGISPDARPERPATGRSDCCVRGPRARPCLPAALTPPTPG